MMNQPTIKALKRLGLSAAVLLLPLLLCLAQYRDRPRRFWDGDNTGPIVQTEGGEPVNEDTVRTARETVPYSVDWPAWTNPPGFDQDVFTFARIVFKSRPGRPSWSGWINDYPDGDLNLSYRLQELTSMKVNPDGRVLKLTDPALYQYPFIFMTHADRMELRDEEVRALRNYLLNGGALMTDDFWSTRAWEEFEQKVKRILPKYSWIDLPMEHQLFHCVFDLHGPLDNLQVPTLQLWRRNYDPGNPMSVPSAFRGPGSRDMHVRAWLDEKQRIMIVAIHNSDTGDGWEREGEDQTYFQQFSEPRSYPLTINIVFYLMTH